MVFVPLAVYFGAAGIARIAAKQQTTDINLGFVLRSSRFLSWHVLQVAVSGLRGWVQRDVVIHGSRQSSPRYLAALGGDPIATVIPNRPSCPAPAVVAAEYRPRSSPLSFSSSHASCSTVEPAASAWRSRFIVLGKPDGIHADAGHCAINRFCPGCVTLAGIRGTPAAVLNTGREQPGYVGSWSKQPRTSVTVNGQVLGAFSAGLVKQQKLTTSLGIGACSDGLYAIVRGRHPQGPSSPLFCCAGASGYLALFSTRWTSPPTDGHLAMPRFAGHHAIAAESWCARFSLSTLSSLAAPDDCCGQRGEKDERSCAGCFIVPLSRHLPPHS